MSNRNFRNNRQRNQDNKNTMNSTRTLDPVGDEIKDGAVEVDEVPSSVETPEVEVVSKEVVEITETPEETPVEPPVEVTEATVESPVETPVETKYPSSTPPKVVDLGVKDTSTLSTPPKPTTPTTAPVPTSTTLDKYQQAIAESKVKQLVEKGGSALQKNAIASMEHYAIEMRPGRVFSTPEEQGYGLRRQLALWQTITQVTDQESMEEFRKTWTTMLSYMYEQREGAFNERYLFRFAHLWSRDPKELAMFQAILNLMVISCNPDNRGNLDRMVSMEKTLEGWNQTAKANLLQYYQ